MSEVRLAITRLPYSVLVAASAVLAAPFALDMTPEAPFDVTPRVPTLVPQGFWRGLGGPVVSRSDWAPAFVYHRGLWARLLVRNVLASIPPVAIKLNLLVVDVRIGEAGWVWVLSERG